MFTCSVRRYVRTSRVSVRVRGSVCQRDFGALLSTRGVRCSRSFAVRAFASEFVNSTTFHCVLFQPRSDDLQCAAYAVGLQSGAVYVALASPCRLRCCGWWEPLNVLRSAGNGQSGGLSCWRRFGG